MEMQKERKKSGHFEQKRDNKPKWKRLLKRIQTFTNAIKLKR